MSTISSLSSYTTSAMYTTMQASARPVRPDPAQMAQGIFSKIDADGNGALEKGELQSALSTANASSTSTTTNSASSANVDDLFAKMDADGNGSVTATEFADVFKSLADRGGHGGPQGMGGMPPPPPPPPVSETDSDSDTDSTSDTTTLLSATTDSTTTTTASSDASAQVIQQIAQLLRAYGNFGQDAQQSTYLSVAA